ncbi:MAG: hypothetical protein Q9224_006475 [Gallowayella concinna]
MGPRLVSNYLYWASTNRYWESIRVMKDLAQQAVDERKEHPKAKNDLLNAMLYDTDPKTRKRMTELSVVQNLVTFPGAGNILNVICLSARLLIRLGYETITGMLSFLLLLLLKNPA